MTSLYRSLILAASLAVLAACAPSTGGVSVSSDGTTRIDNSSFEKKVTIAQVRNRLQGDQMQGSAVLVSRASSDMRVQYRFSWFDINGYAIDDEGQAWKSVKLHGGQQLPVNALAPNNTAVKFEVYVREAIAHNCGGGRVKPFC
ncbi:YcfL family protein [Paraferrimonas sedimenticola]|uniref:DUF1425 domain-containing protein n=1 Tax=Paraferrimonas sedimenticola TaxID=375674 RepID=A0AA37W153_9GAMM|nr:YcfL family protein [Paraferrimonas sedimenticola]GLP96448.1 hypothetical protein GCM10007895_17540 [Paraferrimonas sedimenticola]